MKFCPNCGKELKSGVSFCANCGTSVNTFANNQNNKSTFNTQTNQPNQDNNNQFVNNVNSKSKVAAGVLGILLGVFGAHNFYLGYTGKAIAQLLITLLSCGLLSPISGIWALIEAILIFTGSTNVDANGNFLVD